MDRLPIDSLLPEIVASLARTPNLVLQAPPGAGKTTRVPPALLGASWLGDRRVIVLEPRRLAARSAAARMASERGEAVGGTIGYRVRLDSRVGPATRVELVTDGLFLRRLQDDPGLEGIGAVVFDEIHERSLDIDLALALCLEAQGALRPDLRLIAMSATLDAAPFAALLGGAPVLTSPGRLFAVENHWLGRPAPPQRLHDAVAAAVRQALRETPGDVLAFLPGAGEIRRTAAALEQGGLPPATDLYPLHGDLDLARQDAAIAPSPAGRRKIVLATSIAETSLTIQGVRAVVDGGMARVPRFDPDSGMSGLETVRVSQAAAEQRRGRAGRTAPGHCYRLWSEAEHRGLPAFAVPEICDADLAPLALELAQWGIADSARLAWLDPPPAAAMAQARDLLQRLGALDAGGAITAHGRAMAELGTHPRLAHMLLRAKAAGQGALACAVAALLEERDVLRGFGPRDIDLRSRLAALAGEGDGAGIDRGARDRVRRVATLWRKRLAVRAEADSSEAAGLLVALAYPDRIAQRRGLPGTFRLANGRGAQCDPAEPLAAQDFIAVADLDGAAQNARIYRAAPLAAAELRAAFAERLSTAEEIVWDEREGAVKARRLVRLDALVLEERRLDRPDEAALRQAVLTGLRQAGIAALPWTRDTDALRHRVRLLRAIEGSEAWPDLSDQALAATIEDWLSPYLGGISRRAQFGAIPLAEALRALLGWDRQRRLDRLAPTHWTVPSGRTLPIDYAGETPVLACRIQEMFGTIETPAIVDGRVPLLIHLLSPAGRPIQVTRDLKSFWSRGYREARADLRGRYPRHYWPDDPLQAEPTARAKPRPR